MIFNLDEILNHTLIEFDLVTAKIAIF